MDYDLTFGVELLSFEVSVFSVQAFKEITLMLFQICLTQRKEIY